MKQSEWWKPLGLPVLFRRALVLGVAALAIEGGGELVKADCDCPDCTCETDCDTCACGDWDDGCSPNCKEGWNVVCWTGCTDNKWTTTTNWQGLQGDDYPGESGSEDYCVVIDHPDENATIVIDDADYTGSESRIQVRTIFVGAGHTLKIKPGGDLQLSRSGAEGGTGTGGSGPRSLDCDGEVWISSGCSACETVGDRPARFALDGGDAVTGGSSTACILNGRIIFYQESGAGTDPGVFTRTKCCRLVCDSGSPCDGYVENDTGSSARGVVANTGLDTLTWGPGITFRGDLEIGPYIWNTFSTDMGVIDANTSTKSINLITGPNQAMGTYRASGGTLVAGNAGGAGPTISGSGVWELTSGTMQFNQYVTATGLTGEIKVSGGTLDVDADVTTSQKTTASGSCTVDVATGKALTVSEIEIGSDSGSVTLTRSGAGDLNTT